MATQEEMKAQIEQEISTAGDLFRSLDASGDGSVSKKELANGLGERKAALESDANEALTKFYQELIANFDAADKSDDDKLSFVEFILFFDSLKEKFLASM